MKEDKYIWEEFKNEEEYALSYIYHQNIDFLFFYGKKFTSNEDFILDIIQDMFYDLIRYRESLGATDNIRLYLLKSFRRKLVRELEKNKKKAELDGYYFLEPDIVFSVEEDLIRDEEQSKKLKFIRQGLQELNAKQREILYYRFTCGFDYGQICEIMSVSYDSARQLVSRAISSMKKYLSDNDLIFLLFFRKLTS
jgi:RNA polymerase sigma factor (sigma-70 family)